MDLQNIMEIANFYLSDEKVVNVILVYNLILFSTYQAAKQITYVLKDVTLNLVEAGIEGLEKVINVFSNDKNTIKGGGGGSNM